MTAPTLRFRPAGRTRPGNAGEDRRGRIPPLVVAGARFAAASAGIGLAVLVILVIVGWIASPHLGIGLAGALRTAAVFWLAAHHVTANVRGAGRIGMLPLGLVLLPGALLWRAGRMVIRGQRITGPRPAFAGVLAVAVPYGLLAGFLALVSRSSLSAASVPEALAAGFGVAFVAAGFGAARALAPWRRLADHAPLPARSVVAGMTAALAVLAGAGAVAAAIALAGHLPEYGAVYRLLGPGFIGGTLLLLAQVAYLPNAIIWAISYMLGPGFAVGTGTVVAPTGSVIGQRPAFPLLAALPGGAHGSGPAWLTVALMAVPYLAGGIGGLVCVRVAPSAVFETAFIRGFACGAGAGVVLGVLAGFSGGSLGDGRMSAVGPSAWQVALVGTLEVGIAGAIAAGLANWWHVRRSGVAPEAGAPGARAGRTGEWIASASDGDSGDDGHVIFVDQWAATGDADAGVHRPRGPADLP